MVTGSLQGQQPGPTDSTADELFEMANLFPRTTGLPMTIWIGPRGGAPHDARVKVSLTPGKMDIANTAVIGIRPRPHLIQGTLSAGDPAAVQEWITLNEAVLIEFGDEAIDSVELGSRLRKLGG